jgi:hypothetical protein
MNLRRAYSCGGPGGLLRISPFCSVAILLATPLLPASFGDTEAQETDRIWGRVETAAGRVYEGFIRWDRNEGSWVDLLDGRKETSRETEELWKELSDREEPRRERVIEFFGVRISWDDRDFPGAADSGIRFGHIRRLTVLDDQTVGLELKSGERLKLEGGSTDLGDDMRELLVEDPEEGSVELRWLDLDEIEFGPAPASARSEGTRLYGTVEDRWGDRYTGYISWDLDEILTTDILDGEEDGRDREIPFERISAIEKDLGRSRVFLTDGEEMVLSGSNDVDDGHRGIQISDPGLGMVEVEWDEFSFIRFHEPEVSAGYEDFDGGHRLRGTVVTQDDEEFTGWILWDADEGYSWEILNGEDRDIVYDVEFGKIATIERDSYRSAQVTLLDGRVLEMEGSNDVNEENKGILIQVDDQAGNRAEGWVLVSWDDFRQLRFDH